MLNNIVVMRLNFLHYFQNMSPHAISASKMNYIGYKNIKFFSKKQKRQCYSVRGLTVTISMLSSMGVKKNEFSYDFQNIYPYAISASKTKR